MFKTKKIFGILLALCFVLSVTAAAVSAAPGNGDFNQKDNHRGDFDHNHRGDFDQKDNHRGDFDHNHRGDFDQKDYNRGNFDQKDYHIEYRNNYHHNHYHPGHWEKHREGHKEYRNNHWVVVYKIVTVYKTAYWN